MLLLGSIPPISQRESSLTCDAVKGLYQESGCCAETGSSNIGTCDHLNMNSKIQVPANINYDSMSVRFDYKKMIRSKPHLYDVQKRIYESENTPELTGCSRMCYKSAQWWNPPEIQAVLANFPKLKVPAFVPVADFWEKDERRDYNYNPYKNDSIAFSRLYDRIGMRQPVTCDDEDVLNSQAFKDAINAVSEDYDDYSFDGDSKLFEACDPQVSEMGGLFMTLMDGLVHEDYVYTQANARTLTKFKASDMSYHSQPVATTMYGKVVRPDWPEMAGVLRNEIFIGINGGTRSNLAAHGDHVCAAGATGQWNWNEPPPSSDATQRKWGPFLQELGIDDTVLMKISAACYNKNFQDGDPPERVYTLQQKDVVAKLKLTKETDFSGFNNQMTFSTDINIRDMDMTEDSIFMTLMGGTGSGFFVVRISRDTGEWHITKHSSFIMRDQMGGLEYSGNARTFHMAIDDHFIHVTQSKSGNQEKRLFKFRRNFEDLEGAIGVRDLSTGGNWIKTAGFFGANVMTSFGDKVYLNNNGMYVSTNDYTFQNTTDNIGVKQILWPASKQWRISQELFYNSELDGDYKIRSINYGATHSATHVFFMYGMSRDYDVAPNDQTKYNPLPMSSWDYQAAHDVHWLVFKVDPSTDTVVDTIEVVTEQAGASESFEVDEKGEYGYIFTGDSMRDADFSEILPTGRIDKVRLSSGTKEVDSSMSLTGGSLINTIHLEAGNTHKSTLSFDGLHMMSDGNEVENIRIKRSELGIAHMHKTDRNVYLGTNVGNLGIPQRHHVPSATQSDNIIIGTDSGNSEHGMYRNIIIGNHMMNGQTVDRSSQLDPAQKAKKKMRQYSADYESDEDAKPTEGQFLVGMHGKKLLEGNLDHSVLNLPGIKNLKDLNKNMNSDKNLNANNAIFVKNNILQVRQNNRNIDGVQLLMDKISALELRLCKQENSQDTTICNSDPITTFSLDIMTTYTGQESLKLQRKVGDIWMDEIVWEKNQFTFANPFDIMSSASSFPNGAKYKVGDVLTASGFNETFTIALNGMVIGVDEGYKLNGKIKPGTYKLSIYDSAENGWMDNEGIGPFGSQNVAGVVFKAANMVKSIEMGTTYKRAMDMDGGAMFNLQPGQFGYALMEEKLGHQLTKEQQGYQEIIFDLVGTYCADEILLEISDSYGDSWNGASLTHDGVEYKAPDSGQDTLTYNICATTLTNGCSVFDFVSGAFDSEVQIKITSDEFGTISLHDSLEWQAIASNKRTSMCPSGTTTVGT